MPKKLAVGARKAGMKGKQSASKRELIEAGENEGASRPAPESAVTNPTGASRQSRAPVRRSSRH